MATQNRIAHTVNGTLGIRSRRTGRVYTPNEIAQGAARQHIREGDAYTGDTKSPAGSGLRSERLDVAIERTRLGNSLAEYDSMRSSRDADIRARAGAFDRQSNEVRAFDRALRVQGAETRDLSTAATGGYLIPASMEPGVLFGARFASAFGGLRLWKSVNRVTGRPSGSPATYPMIVGDVAQNSVAIADNTQRTLNDPTFTSVAFPQCPGQVMELFRVGRGLVEDSNVSIFDVVSQAASQRAARFIDSLAVTNLAAAATLNLTTASAGTVTYPDVVNWISKLADSALQGSPTSVIVVSPTTLKALRLMVDTNLRPIMGEGSYTTVQDDMAERFTGGDAEFSKTIRCPTLLGLPVVTSNALATFAGGNVVGIAGDLDQAGVLRWVECSVMPLFERYSDYGQIGYVFYLRADVQAASTAAFSTLTVHA
jgi:HK97 family phage major capsid protein